MKKLNKKLIYTLSLTAVTAGILPSIITPILSNFNVIPKNNLHTSLIQNKTLTNTNPTKIKDTIANTNSFDVSNLSNNDKYIDWTSIDTTQTSLKKLIIGAWKDLLWDNLPYLSPDEIELDIDNIDHAANGEIIINQIYLTYYFVNNTTDTNKKSFLTNPLTITGLMRKNTTIKNDVNIVGNQITWDGSKILNYTTITVDQYDLNNLDKDLLATNIFDTLPNEFNAVDDLVIDQASKELNAVEATVKFVATIKNINYNGNLLTSAQNIEIVLSGFKKEITWNANLKQADGSYLYQLKTNDQLQVKVIDNDTIATYIEENAIILLNNPELGNENITIDNLSFDYVNKSIVIDASIGNNSLPQIKFTNLIFLPLNNVQQKTQINIDQFAAQFVWLLSNKLNDTNVNDASNELSPQEQINQLKNIFDGLDHVDMNDYELQLNATTYNETGAIYLNLAFIDKNTKLLFPIKTSLIEANKKGISSLKNDFILDTSSGLIDDLLTSLNDESAFNDYIKAHKDIINTYDDLDPNHITFSHQNEIKKENNLIIASVYMQEAVSTMSYISPSSSVKPLLLGEIRIAKDHNVKTTITKNYAYATDQLFANAKTPSSFNEVVKNNKDQQDFLKKLVSVNPSLPQGALITISDVDNPTINDNMITYTFSVTKGYDENGNESTDTKLFETQISYLLLYANDHVTTINQVYQLDGSKYAYEYEVDDLIPLLQITNGVAGVTPTLVIDEINNRTGNIKATVTLSDHQTLDNPHAGKLSVDVFFKFAKPASDATDVMRNKVTITEKESEFEEYITKDEAAQKTLIQKYITLVGETTSQTNWTIKPGSFKKVNGNNISGVELKGVFEVEILLDHYFENDTLLTYQEAPQTTGKIIRFYTIPIQPTKLIDDVKNNGINATDPLAKKTVNELMNATDDNDSGLIIKNWVIANFEDIFEAYPNAQPSVDDFQIVSIEKVDDTTIKVNFKLLNAIDEQGNEGPYIDSFNILQLQQEQTMSNLIDRPLDITTLNINGIDANTYALDIYDGNDNTLKDAIIDSINNHPELYYEANTIPSATKINNRPIVDPNFDLIITPNEDASNISITLKYLQRQKNPNDLAIYVEDTIILETFNTTNTVATKTPINVDASLSNLLPSQVKINDVNLINFIKTATTLEQAFDNYPNKFIATNTNNLEILRVEPDDTKGTLKVIVNVNDARIGMDKEGQVHGYGKLNECEIILDNFQISQDKTVGNTIDISQLTIDGIDKDHFSIDLVKANDATALKDKIKAAINDVKNIDKFFVNAPNTTQIDNQAIINNNVTLTYTYDNDQLIINGQFLSRQENPTAIAQYEPMTIIITGFNIKLTAAKNNIYTINDNVNLTNKLPSQIIANDLKSYLTPDKLKDVLNFLPKVATLKDVRIEETKNDTGEVIATLIIENAKINPDPTNLGFGLAEIPITFKTFAIAKEQIKGKELTVAEAAIAGINGLDNTIYSIDFENKFASLLENAFINNLSQWFDNTDGLDVKINGKAFIQGNLNYAYTNDTVTISGNFLGWNASLNPNDPLQYVPTSITITGFNTNETTANQEVNIESVPNLKSLDVNDPNLLNNLLNYVNSDDGKKAIFNNYPDLMQADNIVVKPGTINPDTGEITVQIYVNNAKVADDGTNNGFGNNVFDVKFTGFKQTVSPTTGKEITVNIANDNGLNGISSNDYAFDFEEQYGDALKNLITADNLDQWLNNAPTSDIIGNQPILNGELNIVYESDKNGKPIVKITGNFISWNESGDKRDPLQYKPQTITITGFNQTNTNASSIDISNIIDSSKYSAKDAVDKLNNDLKQTAQDYFKNHLSDLTNATVGKPLGFDDQIKDAINQGDFEFVQKGDTIQLVVKGLDQAINNGNNEKKSDLVFDISNKFNSTNINTPSKNNIINWDDSLFKTIFGDVSNWSYDWKVDIAQGNLDNMNKLKDYMKNNIKNFLSSSLQMPNNYWDNITIDDNSFIIKNDGDKMIVEYIYTGYENGTLKDNLKGQVTINLKPNPTDKTISDLVDKILNKYSEKEDLSSPEKIDDFINNKGDEIIKEINDTIKDNIPENMQIDPALNKDILKPNPSDNSIKIDKDSITIKGDNIVPITDIKAPTTDKFIRSKKIPKPKNRDWIIYVIFTIFILLIILCIILYELYTAKRRRDTERNLSNIR